MIELKPLTVHDGMDVFELVQEITEGGNGFINSLYSSSFELFQEKLHKNVEMSLALNLEPQYVPQTIFWLYIDNKPVGYGKLRHYLNENLLQHGGHIGYVIRPSARRKGYAKILLSELLKEAKKLNIEKVLLTCDESNIGSRKVIEANQGLLTQINNESCYYWIDL
ncbi:putative acetyltransferase [Bacillus mesophilus]|uniref:GNAT family N-acetyltransferase n=1 Tax=Bacillus mesophilus TaxID=1808955 RepID=A0A6M0QA99_9BACI|nr:GNAT family N-acetyltransferase [Bacillus mesophilus]MBM7662200.1 putative acetyltransferase [Bacillus mesophilus]NEY72450.1 GNAT family N-acetyltransferase [Bacillus mesophilus]